MEEWPSIPEDVVAWFKSVFAEANRRVCERLMNVPNIRETSLDDGLVEALIPETAPHILRSGAIVRMDTHNIGGLRRLGRHWDMMPFRRWETADIAILVFVYRNERLIAKKIGLLQSKRLNPANNDVEDDDEADILYGLNRFVRREDQQAVGTLHRHFVFDENCVFGAIHAGSDQVASINQLNKNFGKVVYYLLYNPSDVPTEISYPLTHRTRVQYPNVGCRVFDAEHVHRVTSSLPEGRSPTFAMIEAGADTRHWSLEVWAADLLLTCQVGQAFDSSRDADVRYFLERRSGPIGAAIAASITLPD